MRIITGEFRGRKIDAPFGNDVRPTSDKVKESIFNILMHDVPDSVCCDLFAGCGNLGLEAISRGATKCYFCDNSRDSIKYIKGNIEKCGAEDRSKVIIGDYMKCLQRIREKVDIFFVDPPYGSGLYEKCLAEIDSLDLLADTGIIIAEHDKYLELPDEIQGLVKFREKRYGGTVISLYGHREEE